MMWLQASESKEISEIVENELYMSDIFAAENLEELNRCQITHILTVAARLPPKYPENFKYKVVSINDESHEDIKQYFRDAIQFIVESIEQKGRVLVHCAAGMSRSGATVCAYLMYQNQWSFDEAFAYGRSKRKVFYPN